MNIVRQGDDATVGDVDNLRDNPGKRDVRESHGDQIALAQPGKGSAAVRSRGQPVGCMTRWVGAWKDETIVGIGVGDAAGQQNHRARDQAQSQSAFPPSQSHKLAAHETGPLRPINTWAGWRHRPPTGRPPCFRPSLCRRRTLHSSSNSRNNSRCSSSNSHRWPC